MVLRKILNYRVNFDKFGEVELHNYVSLDVEEKILALDMRNHPDIKKWMHNLNYISKQTHLEFVNGLKGDTSRYYFLVKQQNRVLGSINFSNINRPNSAEFGIYINPFNQLKGSGKVLEAIANYFALEELAVNKLRLEVFSTNERAINFYNKSGFKLTEIKSADDKDIFCMEKEIVLEEYDG
jgi:UDP-4-amino-4,6-dideoxy-N-acetyl-beta-L-altrosamine N-acetyltransferase